MNREEFFRWLETCPSHRWDILDDFGNIRILFKVEEEEEEDN